MSYPIVVMVTTGSEQQAITIAEEIVQLELAACVNILPTMRSIYRFKDKIYDDEENLLLIKSTSDQFESISKAIKQLHTYEVPEILSFKVDSCHEDFYRWMVENSMGKIPS